MFFYILQSIYYTVKFNKLCCHFIPKWLKTLKVVWVEVSAPPGLASPRSGKVGRHSPSPLSQHISIAFPSLLVPRFPIVLSPSRKACTPLLSCLVTARSDLDSHLQSTLPSCDVRFELQACRLPVATSPTAIAIFDANGFLIFAGFLRSLDHPPHIPAPQASQHVATASYCIPVGRQLRAMGVAITAVWAQWSPGRNCPPRYKTNRTNASRSK